MTNPLVTADTNILASGSGDHKLLSLKEYQGVIIVGVQAFLALLPGLAADEVG